MKKSGIIRTIYLYAFSLLGLILIIIAGVDFIDMGLKAFVFTQAEEQTRMYEYEPPYAPRKIMDHAEDGKSTIDGKLELTEEQMEDVEMWLEDYADWKERQEKFDPIISRRHRDASRNIAMLLVGFPLYLYHWAVIKKEEKEKA